MDRRAFLTGVGTIGAASAAGWSAFESGARSARAAALANSAGAPVGGSKGDAPGVPPGLTLGYLPGSAGLLDYAARGQRWDHLASQMRWASWHPSLSYPTFDERVDVAIGRLQSAQVFAAPGLLKSIEVVAHFALDDAVHVAPFRAWRHESAGLAKQMTATSPLAFEAGMPDRVGLQVSYAFSREFLVPGIADNGMVYLPLGARDGPGVGIYVLASPSRITGALPDLTEYRFSGDLRAPLLRDTGGTPDFDFVPLTIAPVTA